MITVILSGYKRAHALKQQYEAIKNQTVDDAVAPHAGAGIEPRTEARHRMLALFLPIEPSHAALQRRSKRRHRRIYHPRNVWLLTQRPDGLNR